MKVKVACMVYVSAVNERHVEPHSFLKYATRRINKIYSKTSYIYNTFKYVSLSAIYIWRVFFFRRILNMHTIYLHRNKVSFYVALFQFVSEKWWTDNLVFFINRDRCWRTIVNGAETILNWFTSLVEKHHKTTAISKRWLLLQQCFFVYFFPFTNVRRR